MKMVKRAEPQFYRSDQILWLNMLNEELDNLRTALEWSIAMDVETGLWMLLETLVHRSHLPQPAG
jgi:hypothetical protein